VQPHLERLSRDVGESASAAVLDGADIVYVARVPTRRIMNVRITIGSRFPAYATALGRALLADLGQAELVHVLVEAAPEPLTSSTLTTSATRDAMDKLRDEYLPRLLRTTREIDADLRRL